MDADLDYNRSMSSRTRWLWVVLILTLVGGLHSGVSFAQGGDTRYFPETGHSVSGEFLLQYESLPNPELIYGSPITGRFTAADNGREVQYFERARFELNLDPLLDLRVVVSPLGEYLFEIENPGTRQTLAVNEATCERIPADGAAVCNSFLTFFYENGGIAVFGYPISEAEWRDGMYVQYFDRACFEWHPELLPGEPVVLGNVGERYFYHVENPSQRSVVVDDFIPDAEKIVLELRAHVFVGQAVIPSKGHQTVYVVVQDQSLRPVPGAYVLIVIRKANGQELRFSPTETTDENGILVLETPLPDMPVGVSEVEVGVIWHDLETHTRTFFQVWW